MQYDNESDSVGTNARLRWTVTPGSDLFLVFNHNMADTDVGWRRESYGVALKVQYAFQF